MVCIAWAEDDVPDEVLYCGNQDMDDKTYRAHVLEGFLSLSTQVGHFHE